MPLVPGTRLGVYDITAPIGEGGMGQVYRARDTRLNRDVALKVLPDSFASDPDRLARFTREAQTLASLNHPNIAHIHGLEESSGVRALVMELVEGDDLSQHIAKGAIPLDEALPIAKQIADALEAAHEQGIIHRDLKPANIMVREDGTVKVLDFGLAKAMDQASGSGLQASGALTNSPTLTSPALMTGTGMILGTAAYMSPEQAKGRAVDRRADVWAFGAVLYEMLSGQRVFGGDDVSDTLANVLKMEPAWDRLPADVPPRVRQTLRACLQKSVKQRIGDMQDVRLALEGAFEGVATPREPMSAPARTLPWVLAATFAVAAIALLLRLAPWRETPLRPPIRASVNLGTDASLSILGTPVIALSPDGATLAFVGQAGVVGPAAAAQLGLAATSQLYVRRLDQLRATALAGTERALGPVFSPDGQWIAFFAGGKLKKIAVSGGAAVPLCDAPLALGATWADDGSIVFTGPTGLLRVSSAGGPPERLTALVDGESIQLGPQVIAGGKAVLFTSSTGTSSLDGASVVAQALPAGERTIVQRNAYGARYLPSGHLLYVHDSALFAEPFDEARLAVTGPPVPVVDAVASNRRGGASQFTVSSAGTLAYVPGQVVGSSESSIQWLDRTGKMTPLRATPAAWGTPRFAPDGKRIAMSIESAAGAGSGANADIWIYEWDRDILTPLTRDPAPDVFPVWTPDSRRIAFGSARGNGVMNLYWQRADGAGEAQRLTDSPAPQLPDSWHPSGKFLAFHEGNPTLSQQRLMVLPIEGDEATGWKPGKPTELVGGPSLKAFAIFSPDGRWFSYSSNESGRYEVYVRPFPGPGGKVQISGGGGSQSMWSLTRSELFYSVGLGVGEPSQIMVVPYTVEGGTFRPEKPRLWSDARVAISPMSVNYGWHLDLHPDGQRFAVAPPPTAPVAPPKLDEIVFVFNFTEYLSKIAPMTK